MIPRRIFPGAGLSVGAGFYPCRDVNLALVLLYAFVYNTVKCLKRALEKGDPSI